MFFIVICMCLNLAMCLPDTEEPIYEYLSNEADVTDVTPRSTIFTKQNNPTTNHLRFRKRISRSDKQMPILEWASVGVTEQPPTPSRTQSVDRTSTRKPLQSEELAGVLEALRQMMKNRKFDGSNVWMLPTTTPETTSTAWFTLAQTTAAGKPADDMLQAATEIQELLNTNKADYYDEHATEATTPLRVAENMRAIQDARPHLRKIINPTPTTTTEGPTTKRKRRKKTTTTPWPRLDVSALLEIVANLTLDYSINLTMMLNKSLEKYSIPTCPTATVTEEEQLPTTDAYSNLTGTIMGKCFVCGLEDNAIPYNAHCADAFAGDFLPLVPVNPRSRAHVWKYRKYCKWKNVDKYEINATDPRNMWGRWTGGCSVRWIDINGIYTQRTCRNRHHATMGNHFLSKRMAKLEMSLKSVDNGCIITPAASLVPMSRGISLYARFHVCVCTGNWCNRASTNKQWTTHLALLFTIINIVAKI